MRVTNTALNFLSLVLVATGLALISTFFFPAVFANSPSTADEASIAPPEEFNVPTLTPERTEPIEDASSNVDAGEKKEAAEKKSPAKKNEPAKEKKEPKKPAVQVPEDKSIWITVPSMGRVEDDLVPSAPGDDEEKLKYNAGIHLEGTGFPWEKEANVYIAGHRLGYPGTNSWLTFYDLNKVDVGDEIYLTDALGRSYTYKVFKDFVVGPADLHVTRPVRGKNIVTLQTCTLPDYSERLIIQAERVA